MDTWTGLLSWYRRPFVLYASKLKGQELSSDVNERQRQHWPGAQSWIFILQPTLQLVEPCLERRNVTEQSGSSSQKLYKFNKYIHAFTHSEHDRLVASSQHFENESTEPLTIGLKQMFWHVQVCAFLEKLGLLRSLQPLHKDTTRLMNSQYHFDDSKNSEVKLSWQKLCIKAGRYCNPLFWINLLLAWLHSQTISRVWLQGLIRV